MNSVDLNDGGDSKHRKDYRPVETDNSPPAHEPDGGEVDGGSAGVSTDGAAGVTVVPLFDVGSVNGRRIRAEQDGHRHRRRRRRREMRSWRENVEELKWVCGLGLFIGL